MISLFQRTLIINLFHRFFLIDKTPSDKIRTDYFLITLELTFDWKNWDKTGFTLYISPFIDKEIKKFVRYRFSYYLYLWEIKSFIRKLRQKKV